MYTPPRSPAQPAPTAVTPPAAPPHGPPLHGGRHRALRLLAAGCVVSAWLTLALSLPSGILMIATRQSATLPGLATSGADSGALQLPDVSQGMSGLDGLGGATTPTSGDRTPALLGLLNLLMPRMMWFSGLMTIVTGVLAWLAQLALGLIIYLILDVEEHTRLTAQALMAITRRTGA